MTNRCLRSFTDEHGMSMKKRIQSLAVLTSGGDSPGMNACIRSIVRSAAVHGMKVYGVENGLQGLVSGAISEMTPRDVSGIINKGGTILGTARCAEFYHRSGRKLAAQHLAAFAIDALIIIGGDGSFRGGYKLYKEFGVPFIGLPGTIDNDMFGTDYTIGYDTAVNTAMQAIDKIRDTAESHHRLFFIEVMGRNCGAIALDAALAGGVEDVLIPETSTDLDALAASIVKGKTRGKRSIIVVVAEGDEAGDTFKVARAISKRTKLESRVCVLGHTQRGGPPSARDRVLATRLGHTAVTLLRAGIINVFVGEVHGKVQSTPVQDVVRHKRKTDTYLQTLTQILAR